MHTLLLDSDDVRANAPMKAVIPAVEAAFGAYERGDAQMPAKSYIDLPQYSGDFRSMPAYLHVDGDAVETATGATDWDAAGVKWVTVHTDNNDRGLPTVLGTMIYSDPETGVPLAVLDGRQLTMLRTGAAAAVATDHLAIGDASSLGIIGAGVQSYTQLEAISTVRPIETVIVADQSPERVADFIARFENRFDIRGGEISEAAACDVLSTVTPVESPIVDRADVSEHTHINAIGADADGKHELADEILLDAKLVIDDYAQTTHSGEINVPYSAGTVTDSDIYGALGEIVIDETEGRTPNDGITVFDSTGLAIQDVATAHVVYTEANDVDNGTAVDLLGLADT